MVKRIFFDANLLIDLLNEDNDLNKPVSLLFKRFINTGKILLCSPTTFAITYYLIGKRIKDTNVLNEKVLRLFASFEFTKEDKEIMNKVRKSSFTDLEDALQYYSAIDGGADIIITNNHFDFFKSSIPVYHPLQYLQQFIL